jgi:HK97 family phage portal protein
VTPSQRMRLRQWGPRRLLERRQKSPVAQLAALRSGALASTGSFGFAGLPVSERLALTLSAFFCSLRVQCQAKGSLPLKVYERSRNANQRDAEVASHPVSELLRNEPSKDMTEIVWKEVRQAHVAVWGKSFAELQLDGRGQVVDALPIHPTCVEPVHDDGDRDEHGRPRLKYRISDSSGSRTLDATQVLHTLGLSLNGIDGLSVIRYAAGSLGISLGADKLAATFITNGAKPSIVVTTPGFLDDDAFGRLQREINQEFTGDEAFRAMLLEGDAKVNPMTMPFAEMQFLETRKFQGEEIASRWFGLPPHLAGFLDNAHYNNLAEQDRAFVIHSLMPWLIRDEQEMNRKLFTGRDRGRFYVKHNADALLRGDTKSRYEAHSSAIQSGWKTRNEVRADEDLPPLPGGDVLPSPAAIWGKTPEPAPPAAPSRRSAEDPADPRLGLLLSRTLEGLLAAERIQAQRSAGQPERLERFYEGHQRKLIERLDGLVDHGAIAAYCRNHREQLERAVRDADPAAAVELCVEGWAADVEQLGRALTTERRSEG